MAASFSAPSRQAASTWRCPRPTWPLSSGGPGCCSCSRGAPGAPCAPAGCSAADPPSPAAGSLPGSRSSPPRTLPAGHGSPVGLLSAVATGGWSLTVGGQRENFTTESFDSLQFWFHSIQQWSLLYFTMHSLNAGCWICVIFGHFCAECNSCTSQICYSRRRQVLSYPLRKNWWLALNFGPIRTLTYLSLDLDQYLVFGVDLLLDGVVDVQQHILAVLAVLRQSADEVDFPLVGEVLPLPVPLL